MSLLKKKQAEEERNRRQVELVRKKEVRAVPGGYYTGLISDMHEDLRLYQERNIFTPIRSSLPYPYSLSSPQTDHFSHDEVFQTDKRKLFDHTKTPLIYSPRSIQFTLPTCLIDLERMSAVDFLVQCSNVTQHRKQIILKLLRKWPNDFAMETNEMKEFVFDYLNGCEKKDVIDKYFDFLDIHSIPSYSLKSLLVPVCAYAERYFYDRYQHDHSKTDDIRPLQEIVDLEFMRRKLDGMSLNPSLERLLKTLQH